MSNCAETKKGTEPVPFCRLLFKVPLDDGLAARHHLLALGVHLAEGEILIKNEDIGVAVRLEAALLRIEVQGLCHIDGTGLERLLQREALLLVAAQ